MKKTVSKTVKAKSGGTAKGAQAMKKKKGKQTAKAASSVKGAAKKAASKPSVKAKVKALPKPAPKAKVVKPAPKPVKKAAAAAKAVKAVKAAPAKVKKAVARVAKPAKKQSGRSARKPIPVKTVKNVKTAKPAAPAKSKSVVAAKPAPIKKEKAKEVAIVKPKAVEQKAKIAAPVQQPAAAPPMAKRPKLKAEDLRKLRDALEQERRRLIEEIRALDDQALTDGFVETMGQQPGFSLQLADSASDNQQVDTALGIRSIEADQLAQIDEALRAIETGEYGVCHRCHEAIHLDRLLVKPMAKYCVPCLRLLETGKA